MSVATRRRAAPPAIEPESRNGVAPAPAAPELLEWLEVPDYPGHRALVWVNYPQRLGVQLHNTDAAVSLGALLRLCRAHNDWPDPETGKPYPAMGRECIDAIPLHLLVRLLKVVKQAGYTDPKSSAPRTSEP